MYRKLGYAWIEGDHLCRAALARGLQPKVAVFAKSFWPQAPVEWAQAAPQSCSAWMTHCLRISAAWSPRRAWAIVHAVGGRCSGAAAVCRRVRA